MSGLVGWVVSTFGGNDALYDWWGMMDRWRYAMNRGNVEIRIVHNVRMSVEKKDHNKHGKKVIRFCAAEVFRGRKLETGECLTPKIQ